MVSESGNSEVYNHITFRIENLSDYMKIINIANVHRSFRDLLPTTVFRGMSNHNWKLEPSYKREFNYCKDFENSMITEIKTLRPKEFSNELSNFDLLAKLQHFGLPTRLLDFSTNPLVALYFACRDNFEETGRVVCTNNTSDTSTIDLIENICGTYKFTEYDNLFLEKIIGNRSIQSYFLNTVNPLMQKPKYLNERLIRQSAIFMIFPNRIYDLRAHNAYDAYLNSDNEFFNTTAYNMSDILKYEKTEEIYTKRKLQTSKCDDEKLSCYVDNSTFEKIRESYKSHNDFCNMKSEEFNAEFNEKMQKRFVLDPVLQDIPKEVLQNCFCSIIIEPKHKKQILKELNLININEAFLFPELEYTAKQIKEKFIYEVGDFKYIK